MFQDALVESSGRLKTKKRTLDLIATGLNLIVLVALMLWPLFHPQALPRQVLTRLLVAPAPPSAPATPAVASRATSHPPIPLMLQVELPSVISRKASSAPMAERSVEQGAFAASGIPGGLAGTPGDAISALEHAPLPFVAVAASKKVAISSGVMAGNRIAGETPIYSAIARAARVQGTVTLQATISKSGSIENLRVVSGPPMLVASAIQAVSTWRYRPYLLNDHPVEVETTINVVFDLSN